MAFGNFNAADQYLRRKINFPSPRGDELWHGEHACGFVVAGVARMDVLDEIRTAVDAARCQGETLADFRKRFRQIVREHGWPGGPGGDSEDGFQQRTEEIYFDNLRLSYMAGRWETLRDVPYLKYQHNTPPRGPGRETQAWDGLIIPRDDPWWQTHYPPNGVNCRDTVYGVSEVNLRVAGKFTDGKSAPDAAPGPSPGDPEPEWAYHVGETAHSLTAIETFAQKVMRLSPDMRGVVFNDALKRKAYWAQPEWEVFMSALHRDILDSGAAQQLAAFKAQADKQ